MLSALSLAGFAVPTGVQSQRTLPSVAADTYVTTELAALASRIAALEAAAPAPCDSSMPHFAVGARYSYNGLDRNVHRNATQSVQTHQNGTVFIYNASLPQGGSTQLFDVAIAANDPHHDVWHFSCALTAGEPHLAFCTLTFEKPLRPEGPAWVRIRFSQLSLDKAGRCIAGSSTSEPATGHSP